MKYFSGCIAVLISFSFYLEAHGHHHHHDEEEGFHWTKEKTECADIHVQIAGPGIIQNFIQVSGKITAHPDSLAYVISKVNGSVWEVRKNLGDEVEKGALLALIESPEVAEAQANYLAATKKLALQQILLKKEELLRGISPQQDYLNAKLAAEEAFIQTQLALQNLYILGFTQQDINNIDFTEPEKPRLYELRAPLAGKILQRNLTLGELIDPSTKAFTIANFDKVWIEMNVAQMDVSSLKEGLWVEIVSCGKKAAAKVSQFNPAISEETRMATAIAVMDNSPNRWNPGEFVTVKIQTDVTEAPIVVPREALQTIKGQQVIFTAHDEEFIPSIVKVGKMDDKNAQIISGLQPGTPFAATNTFCLKAELEKGEAEHHH